MIMINSHRTLRGLDCWRHIAEPSPKREKGCPAAFTWKERGRWGWEAEIATIKIKVGVSYVTLNLDDNGTIRCGRPCSFLIVLDILHDYQY